MKIKISNINSKFIKTFFTFSNKEFSSDYVNYWQECGFNLASTFTFNPALHDLNNFRKILLQAQSVDIDVLVSDERVSYKKLKEIGREAFIKNVESCLKDYGDIPSFIGFFLGDEPWYNLINEVIESNLIIELINPSLKNFVNFFPYFDNENTLKILGCSSDYYVEYLVNVITKGHYFIWGVDHYGALWQHEKERGYFQYFKTIECAKEAMARTGSKCIFAGTCVGHNNISQPDFNALRWQVSIAFMHGFKGINWYKFYDTGEGINFLLNGVYPLFPIDCFKSKTKTFDDLKYVNKWFDDKFLTLSCNLRFYAAYLDSTSINDDKLVSFYGDHGLKIMVSKFIDNKGLSYYFVMNLDMKLSEVAFINFKNNTKSMWLLPGEMALIENGK